MDTSKKIIRGVVNSRGFTITSPITQWDYGWQFIPEIEDLPATYRLDFSNEEKHGTALPVYCGSEGAEVPTELIDTGKDIWVWFVRIGDGYGITEYKWRIPNKCKPKTEQDEPTPSQQSSIDQAISVINDAAETAQENADKAETAVEHYPQIVDGTWRVWDVENGEWLDTGIDAEAVDGVSPTVYISNSDGIHTVTIIDADGRKTATIYDGLTIIMLTSSFVIPTDENGVLTQDVRLVAKFRIMRGNTIIDGRVMPNSRITLVNPNAQEVRAVHWRDGVFETDPQTEVTLPSGYKLLGNDSGAFDIKLRVGNTDYVVNPTWALAKRGEKGEKGDSPAITASKTGDTTYIYADGSEIAQIKDGQDGSGAVEDVQINGTSILNDGTANIPIADSQLGAVFVSPSVGETGLDINSQGIISTFPAPTPLIKGGTNGHMPITPDHQHESAFYGLAKASGVGTYTEDAKSKISEMLGGSVSVSGATPTIVAKSGIRYVCGEVATLDFTPSQTGICDVVFTSGSTPTVVTLPSTVKFPDGSFVAEADTTYEINILDGVYGAVMAWT